MADEDGARQATDFRPYIPPQARLRELTWAPLVVGTVLGVVFGASSLYLVLKVGLTVSASIPVAVISITFFRVLSKLGVRHATILENNIAQTAGSAGESIAFGIGVTMPAIMILGFDLEATRVTLVAVLGGLLGILMMIPLRRALIVEQHDKLKYPEGTACAEVLKAGASDESRAAAAQGAAAGGEGDGPGAPLGGAGTVFGGFALGAVYKAAMVALKGWRDVPEKIFGPPLAGGSISAEISPELLGVGYIIGPTVASRMCAGGVLAYLVLIPAIKLFGQGLAGPLPPGSAPIAAMSPDQIRGAYVLYIGAGAVAAGGIVSLLRSLPTIYGSIKGGLRDLRGARGGAAESGRSRTDRDLPMRAVLVGVVALVVAIAAARPLHMNVGGAALIVVFGFLFATVSSRLTGEIGSSSNPISGMTVATLLLTCAIFLLLGWTGPGYYVTALSVGAVVCVAASNAGTTSQDLKTGFLVGATPRLQQIAILVGALASALALGPILLRLNDAATVYVPRATTESAVVDGRTVTRSVENFSAELRADVPVSALGPKERLQGPQAQSDPGQYRAWHKELDDRGPAGRYLVDDEGRAVYLVDPGINGTHATRPDGTRVAKFDAPKATLMSYIIKGILNRQLPWGLVLLGVMIAVVLEMSGVPSLAFAVGVYLPLSSSTPIFVGGAVRWLTDASLRRRRLAEGSLRGGRPARAPTDEELAAEGDKSPGCSWRRATSPAARSPGS
ncbi:MAG TPA: oligopeptide transporter, OPT family [Polyangiaceae bacterium]|nr:oligopeptide transporter, OPT family [Polyangiaceae bacterium]